MSINLHCNVGELCQTPTETTFKLLSHADPSATDKVWEAENVRALEVMQAYVEWYKVEYEITDADMAKKWYNQPWAVTTLSSSQRETLERKSAEDLLLDDDDD